METPPEEVVESMSSSSSEGAESEYVLRKS